MKNVTRVLGVEITILFVALACMPARGTVSVSPEELLACRTWADRVFATDREAGPGAFLKILYEDVADGVARGRSWRGTPF